MDRALAFVTATLGVGLVVMTASVAAAPDAVGGEFAVAYLIGTAVFLLAGLCGGIDQLLSRDAR